MNYQKHYDLLIETRKNRSIEGYTEEHHIVPRCLKGSGKKFNLIKLTAREHYMAHWLLWKATKDPRLGFAFGSMIQHKDGRKFTARQYERAKTVQSELMKELHSGKPKSEETKKKMSESARLRMSDPEARARVAESNRTRKISEETKKKMSDSSRKRWGPVKETPKKEPYVFTEEHKRKLKESRAKQVMGPLSEETKRKLSEKLKGVPKKKTKNTKDI